MSNHRDEQDIRGERVASEIRTGELEVLKRRVANGERFKLYQCSNCHRLHEERSLHCPICGAKKMGELKPRSNK